MTKPGFSFVELDRRLREIPDGPASILNTPRWIVRSNIVGWLGAVLGLLPSVLIEFMTPAMWMVWVARAGLWIALLGFAPGFVQGTAAITLSFWRWRSDQVRQLDHDLAYFRGLREWLSLYSIESRTEALRFARANGKRLGSKLGLVAGSIEKLGFLPVAAALAVQLKVYYSELGDTPLWQIGLAVFLALMYGVGVLSSLMRLRLELYEIVLEDSLSAEKSRSRHAIDPASGADGG